MDKGRAYIMGELEFETGNIELKLAGKRIGHIVLVVSIIKAISDETGFSTNRIMKDITTALERGKWINDKPWRTADERGGKKNENGVSRH